MVCIFRQLCLSPIKKGASLLPSNGHRSRLRICYWEFLNELRTWRRKYPKKSVILKLSNRFYDPKINFDKTTSILEHQYSSTLIYCQTICRSQVKACNTSNSCDPCTWAPIIQPTYVLITRFLRLEQRTKRLDVEHIFNIVHSFMVQKNRFCNMPGNL